MNIAALAATLAMLPLQVEEALLPEGLDIGFKLLPAIIVIVMMLSFLAVGFFFKVANTDDMWVAGRSIGNVENGMAIGANWMSAASYLGMAALIALDGVYGLAFVVGWTTGYFILLIFMAAQMRRFGKYTAPDFVGDRFNSDTARAIAAITTFLIGFVYALGQARGMGLVGMYILGDINNVVPIPGLDAYQAMMVLFMIVTIAYLSLSGMLGATKNMALQYVILIVAFLVGLLATGWAPASRRCCRSSSMGNSSVTSAPSSPNRSQHTVTTSGLRPVSASSSVPVDCHTCSSGSTRSKTSGSPAGPVRGGCSSSRCCT